MKDNGELTLNEAIEHLENDVLGKCPNGKCEVQHRQLYEWLCELRKIKNAQKK